MMQCLTDIVGVTKEVTECINGGLTSEQITTLKKSNSGLYLDDLPGGVHMKALNKVDATKTFFQMSTGAIKNATKSLEDDLVVALNNRYEKSRRNYTGQIGRMSWATSLSVSKRFQGLRIQPADHLDGVMIVSRINLILNQSQAFKLYLYKVEKGSVMGTEVKSWDVSTTANQFFTIVPTIPLSLPLQENGRILEYWFFYDRDEAGGTIQPKDNKIECSTCNQSTGKSTLNDFVKAWGVEFEALDNLNNVVKNEDYSRGIVLDVSFSCDNEQLFCREYNEQDAIAVTMSRAVWYKGGELLIEEVLKSPDVNRYTTMAREYLWGKRNHFKKEYESRIVYLAASIDVSASNCYVCRQQANQPINATIFS